MNFLVFGILAIICALMTDRNHLWNTEVHLPTRDCGASLLDPLQDTIYIMKVVPDEALNAGIWGKDFITETVRAGRAWDGVGLRRRLGEGSSGSIPSVSVRLVSGRLSPYVDVVPEGSGDLWHFFL